jgi:hypothetical protein
MAQTGRNTKTLFVLTVLVYLFKSYPTKGPDKLLGFQESEVPRISRQSAHKGGKVVSPKYRPPLPTGKISGTHFC